MSKFGDIAWKDSAGEALTCREKLKVLTENLTELDQMAHDVMEEAILLKVAEPQIRSVLRKLIDELENPYA